MLLVIYKPNISHEIVGPIVEELSKNRPSDVRFGGTTYTKLNNSGKSPDLGIYADDDPNHVKHFRGVDGNKETVSYPTVVIEVGYSESMRDLAEDCGRWIPCSLGRVCLAIGINIKYTFEKDSNGETVPESWKLTSIYCYTWDMEKIDQVSVLPGGEEIDVLRRADGGHRGPASKYYSFLYLEDELYLFQSCNHHKFQLCSCSWAFDLFADNFVGVSNRSTRKV